MDIGGLIKGFFKIAKQHLEGEDKLRDRLGLANDVVLKKYSQLWSRNPFNRPNGYIVVTADRFLFQATLKFPSFTCADQYEIPLNKITQLKKLRIQLCPAISFYYEGSNYRFLVWNGASDVYAAIASRQ